MEHVAPDLVAPAGLDVLASDGPEFGLLLLEGAFEKARLEDLRCVLLVLRLGALVLALHDDPGWLVRQAHGRIGLVDVLPAGALRAVGVHPDLVPIELDLDVVLDLGQHLDQGERGLASLLGVERADPDEAVDAALRAEPAVRAPPLDRHGHALEARLLALLLVDDLGREAVSLGPTQVHPKQHFRPIGRLGSTRAGADREQRGTLVVFAGEQQRGPFAPEIGFEPRGIAFQLREQLGVGCLVEQFDGGKKVVGPSEEPLPQGNLLALPVGLAKDLLRGPLIVPEARLLGQLLELGDSSVLGRKVKASPRSRGSTRPGRGWRRRPPSSGPADPGAGSA